MTPTKMREHQSQLIEELLEENRNLKESYSELYDYSEYLLKSYFSLRLNRKILLIRHTVVNLFLTMVVIVLTILQIWG